MTRNYSGFKFAVLDDLPDTLSISVAQRRRRIDRSTGPTLRRRSSCSRDLMSGSRMTLLIAALSRVAISVGKPCGPKNPAHSVKSKFAMPGGLGDRRHVGRQRRALGRRHREHLDPAALHQRHGARIAGKIEIDLAAGHVVQGRAGALVRHVDQLAVELELQQFAGEMAGRADAGGGKCQRLVGAQRRHPLRHRRDTAIAAAPPAPAARRRRARSAANPSADRSRRLS